MVVASFSGVFEGGEDKSRGGASLQLHRSDGGKMTVKRADGYFQERVVDLFIGLLGWAETNPGWPNAK
ncbi:hypothetical protein Dimus_014243, partial [Dionaea muscipula]